MKIRQKSEIFNAWTFAELVKKYNIDINKDIILNEDYYGQCIMYNAKLKAFVIESKYKRIYSCEYIDESRILFENTRHELYSISIELFDDYYEIID